MSLLLTILKQFWPYIAAFTIGLSVGGGGAWKIQGYRITEAKQELAAFEQQTEAAGLAAEKEAQRIETEHTANLAKVKEDHENLIPAIREGAVAQYLAHVAAAKPVVVRKPAGNPGSGAVPNAGSGIKVDAGAIQKCIPDTEFIANAAEDATKVATWIEWCSLNKCPVQ